MENHRILDKKIRKKSKSPVKKLHKALVEGERRRLKDVKAGKLPFCYGNMDCEITGKCSICDLHNKCFDASFVGFYAKNTPEYPGIDEFPKPNGAGSKNEYNDH